MFISLKLISPLKKCGICWPAGDFEKGPSG